MFSPTCALYNTRFEQASPNIATTSSVNTFFVICFPELPFLSAYSLGISSCKPCFPQLFLEWHTVICDVIFPKYFSLGCLFFDKCFFGQKNTFHWPTLSSLNYVSPHCMFWAAWSLDRISDAIPRSAMRAYSFCLAGDHICAWLSKSLVCYAAIAMSLSSLRLQSVFAQEPHIFI